MPEQTYLEAIRAGLHEEMSRDASVYLFGEDVALGGPFGVTHGLVEAFGKNRVVNTPISEGTVMGLAIGAALSGLRPVIEISSSTSSRQWTIVPRGQAPLHVWRAKSSLPHCSRAVRGIKDLGAHHSSLESWFLHVPGLKAVMPANAADAKGLLKSAVRDDNPVFFIEHRGLYWSRGQVPGGDMTVPIGKASVLRSGKDVTIVATAKTVQSSIEAAEDLSRTGVSVEVIDPRTLSPLDIATIAASVKKTGRLVIVHEAVEQGGIGAEIASRVQQEAFYFLDSPILRVAAPFAPVPASPSLEKHFVPGKAQIIDAVRKVLGEEKG